MRSLSIFWVFLLCLTFSPYIYPAEVGVEHDTQSLLSAFASYTDLRFTSVQRSLEILASTREVRSGNWPGMQELLRSYEKSDGGLIVWYALPDGTYYTAEGGLMDVKLSDRSYFPDLMAGRTVMAALVISKSTGQRSAVIAIPIKQADSVIAAIGASLLLDKFSDQIHTALQLRPGRSFFALAPNGLTTLHTKTDRHFLDPRELGSSTLKDASEQMLSKNSGEVLYVFDDVQKKAIYWTSPVTQWKFAITYNAAASQK